MKRCINKIILLMLILFISVTFITLKINGKTIIDYTNSPSNSDEIIDIKSLLEIISKDLNYSIVTDFEKEYLDTLDVSVKYNKLISSNLIKTDIVNDDLIVRAKEYKYNEFITWIPKYVVISYIRYDFNDEYEVVIKNISDDLETIEVFYSTELLIDKDFLNDYINYVYDDIYEYAYLNKEQKLIDEYNKSLEDYNNYIKEYNEYLLNIDLYQEYVYKMNEYNIKKYRYDQYLNDLDKYNEEINLYNDYQLKLDEYEKEMLIYNDYLFDLKNYNKKLELYPIQLNDYNNKIKIIDQQLKALNLLTTPMTDLSRTVKDAVLGSTVEQVLNQRKLLVAMGADEAVTEDCSVYTVNVREFLNEYFALTDDYSRYNYYSINYQSIVTNFLGLFQCLEKLYTTSIFQTICSLVDQFRSQSEYKRKFLILLSQLALFLNAICTDDIKNIDNTLIFDDHCKIDGKTINQWLQTDEYSYCFTMESYPLVDGYPKLVEKPVEPTLVNKPIKPQVVNKPVEVPIVESPSNPPSEVIKLQEPQVVEKPNEVFVKDYIYELIKLVKENEFTYRPILSIDYSLELMSSVNKKIRNNDTVQISFFKENNEFINTYYSDYGSVLIYNDEIPQKESTPIIESFDFIGWAYSDNQMLDLSNVTRSGFVYPVYKENIRRFNVTWNVNNKTLIEEYEYGQTPNCPLKLVKESTIESYYEFEKWDKDLDIVTFDITYNAVFAEYPLVSNNGEKVDFILNDDAITFDLNKFKDEKIELEIFPLVFNDLISNYEIRFEFNDVTLVVNKEIIKELKNQEINDSLILNIDYEWLNDSIFIIQPTIQSSNHLVTPTISASIIIKKNLDYKHLYLFEKQSTLISQRLNISNYYVSFNIAFNSIYLLEVLYNIDLEKSNFVQFEDNNIKTSKDKLVKINIKSIENGHKIDEIKVFDSFNNLIAVNDDYTFMMPNCDVTVQIFTSLIEYLVEFKIDDKVIKSTYYHYGDEVVAPLVVAKLDDDLYRYQFVDWDKSIENVTDDITYTAIFNQISIKREPKVHLTFVYLLSLTQGLAIILIGYFVLSKKKKVFRR